jgi:hypothetical protein
VSSFLLQQPLRRKLPLLISSLVFVVVAVLSGFGYKQVERAMIAATEQRVANAAQQVGGMLHESVLGLRRNAHLLASDSNVVHFLQHDSPRSRAAVDVTLRGDISRLPQIVSRALWSRGQLRYSLPPGDSGRASPTLAPSEATQSAMRAWVSPLRLQQKTIVYDVVAPVVAGRDTLGYLVETRRLGTGQS